MRAPRTAPRCRSSRAPTKTRWPPRRRPGCAQSESPMKNRPAWSSVPMRVHTRLFGTLALSSSLKVVGSEAGQRVAWSHSMAFPGLEPGEHLSRQTNLPRRATLLARDGSVLAESGTARKARRACSPLGEFATAVVGSVGPVPAARRAELSRRRGSHRTRSSASAAWSSRSTTACEGCPEASCSRSAHSRVARPACSQPRRRRGSGVRTTISPAVQRPR